MRQRTPNPALLGAFWLGIQVVWGALLGVSLQSRAAELAPHSALASYGLLASAGAAMAGVTQIFAGLLSDRRRARGSRRLEFYFWGVIAAAAALLWFYDAPDFTQLLAAVLLLQVGMNVAIGPYQAAIPDFLDDAQTGNASSWMAALQSIGNAAGAILAGTVSNLRAAAFGIAAALAASAAVTAAHVRSLPLRPAEESRLRVTRAFVDLFVSRALVWLGFYTLLGYLYFFIAPYVSGDAKLQTGLTILIVTVCGAAGAALAARANAMDRRALASAGGGGFAAALLLMVLIAHSAIAVEIIAAGAGAAWGVFLTADWALGCGLLPRHLLATSMGVWNLAVILPQSLAPAVATAVLARLHLLHDANAARAAFILAVAEVACGLAWIWRVPASRPSVSAAVGGNTA